AGTLAFVLFYVLMGAATTIFSLAMLRGLFPRWLGWLGIPAGVLIATAHVGALMDPTLYMFTMASGWTLLVAWLVVAGIRLIKL
ncbi:MAG: hypothetical protein ACE5PO_08155, partial [Candidatus Bathyarchaeia archaeon]